MTKWWKKIRPAEGEVRSELARFGPFKQECQRNRREDTFVTGTSFIPGQHLGCGKERIHLNREFLF
jgi:hypothetical protein